MSHAANHMMESLLRKCPSHNHGTQGCYSFEYKHHENNPGCPKDQAGHHNMGLAGMLHKNHNHNLGAQDCYSPEYKHHGSSMTQAGHHNMGLGGMLDKHTSHNHGAQGCYSSEYKHHGNSMTQAGHHNSNSAGHHGFAERLTGCFSASGSTHGHKPTHNGSHQASYVFTEKIEEHMSYKSGHMKSKLHIKEKSSYTGKCEDSSDSESDDEACKKRC